MASESSPTPAAQGPGMAAELQPLMAPPSAQNLFSPHQLAQLRDAVVEAVGWELAKLGSGLMEKHESLTALLAELQQSLERLQLGVSHGGSSAEDVGVSELPGVSAEVVAPKDFAPKGSVKPLRTVWGNVLVAPQNVAGDDMLIPRARSHSGCRRKAPCSPGDAPRSSSCLGAPEDMVQRANSYNGCQRRSSTSSANGSDLRGPRCINIRGAEDQRDPPLVDGQRRISSSSGDIQRSLCSSNPTVEDESEGSASCTSVPGNGKSSHTATFPIQTLDRLDDMVTNHLFENNGLGIRRPSLSSRRPSVGQEFGKPARIHVSPAESARTPYGSVRSDLDGGYTTENKEPPATARETHYEVKNKHRPARTSSWRLTGLVPGMDALRAEHDTMLVANTAVMHCDALGAEVQAMTSAPAAILCAFGLVPFREGCVGLWYSRVVLGVVAAIFAYAVALAIQEPHLLYNHLSTACLALGGLLGLVCLRARRLEELLGPEGRPLEMYVAKFGFLEAWHRLSTWRFILVLAIWAIGVQAKALAAILFECPGTSPDPAPLASFAFTTGFMAVLLYCQLHVCCALELAVDQFCIRFFGASSMAKGITEWNITQALLRRAAHTVEGCFLAMSTAVLGVLTMTGVEVFTLSPFQTGQAEAQCLGLWAGWVLPPTALVFYTLCRAAAITEKCSRVPSLVNSWVFEDRHIDHDRQYIVEYISHSAAGFYVKGARLNATWSMKLFYFFGVILFTVITRSVLRA